MAYLTSLKGKGVYNASIGDRIVIGTRGIKKASSFTGLHLSLVKMQALACITAILRQSKPYHQEKSYKKGQKIANLSYTYLTTPIRLGHTKERHSAFVVVRQDINGSYYYDLQIDGDIMSKVLDGILSDNDRHHLSTTPKRGKATSMHDGHYQITTQSRYALCKARRFWDYDSPDPIQLTEGCRFQGDDHHTSFDGLRQYDLNLVIYDNKGNLVP